MPRARAHPTVDARMKPAVFEFVRARTLSEATTILLESDGAARVVAGAQSLGPMLNLRLVQPRILVDITGIAELTEFKTATKRSRSELALRRRISRMAVCRDADCAPSRSWLAASPTAPCATAARSG